MKKRMSVGIALSGLAIPAWQYDLVAQLVRSDYVRLDLLLLPGPRPRQGLAERAIASFARQFERRESGRQGCSPDACQPRNASSLLESDRIVRMQQSLCVEEHVEKIAELKLDLLLNLGELEGLRALAGCTRTGVWFFRHDSTHAALSSPAYAGLWEVIHRKPFIHSVLVIYQAAGRPNLTAFESYSGVTQSSFRQTRNEHLWKLGQFVPRALQQMMHQGIDCYLECLTDQNQARPIDNARSSIRAVAEIVGSAGRYALRRLRLKAERHKLVERWILLFSTEADTDVLSRYRKALPPAGRFWADPFVRSHGENHYVFFEDASLKTGLGHISVLTLSGDGKLSNAVPVLQKPYHLSYPFLFEWQDTLYMIPESAANRTVELYRCIRFPDKWVFARTLMQGVLAYDATLVEHTGRWWMFANMPAREGASSWDELCLFHSDSPLSQDWKPHPMNPIVSDVRNARPAGQLFRKAGRLFRPAQNSSYNYGYATNINEILELSETTYKERIVRSIMPSGHFKSTHTYNRSDELTVLDAIYREPRRHTV